MRLTFNRELQTTTTWHNQLYEYWCKLRKKQQKTLDSSSVKKKAAPAKGDADNKKKATPIINYVPDDKSIYPYRHNHKVWTPTTLPADPVPRSERGSTQPQSAYNHWPIFEAKMEITKDNTPQDNV